MGKVEGGGRFELRLNSRMMVFFLPSRPGSVVRHELEDFVDLMRSLGCFEVVVV